MELNPPLWRDRRAAGRELAQRWANIRGRGDTLLIGLPRGGVAVAAAMADVLGLPLAPWAVRKIALARAGRLTGAGRRGGAES